MGPTSVASNGGTDASKHKALTTHDTPAVIAMDTLETMPDGAKEVKYNCKQYYLRCNNVTRNLTILPTGLSVTKCCMTDC